MKPSFVYLLPIVGLFHALTSSAQLFNPSSRKNEQTVLAEFARANGGQAPALTTDPLQSTIYITMDSEAGQVFAITNFRADTTVKLWHIMHLQRGMLDAAELRQLFLDAKGDFSVAQLPILVHNDVFRFFMDTRFMDKYPNVTAVSGQGKKFPVRNRLVEVRPGFFVMPSIELDNLTSFLFERGFDPAEMEAFSLINNKEVNAVLAAAFPHFEAIRTETHIEKAFQKSQKKTVCMIAHISADGQLVRYRSSGEVSYELAATQFLHLGADLHKEVILVGINYADDTSRTLNVAAEVKMLGEAFKNRNWGDVLQSLAGQDNQVQVSEPNTDGFYFKRAEVSRPEGVKPARAYSFIFFKTPAKPSVFISGLRFAYGHSGKILSALVILQLLFFFVFKGEWTRTWKWVNLVFVLIFAFAFLFSFQ